MKSLLIVAAVLLSGSLIAQENADKKKKTESGTTKGSGNQKEKQEHKGEKEAKTPEEKANGLTNRMTNNLGLTDDQKTKIYTINVDMAKKNDAIRKNTALSKEDRRAQLKANYLERKSQYKTILTEEQFAKYESWEKEKKAKHQENKDNNQNKSKGKGKKTTSTSTEEEEPEDEL